MSDDASRLATVREAWRLLENGEMPGHDLYTEDATAGGWVFGTVLPADTGLLRDRWGHLIGLYPDVRVALGEAYAAPGERVVITGAAMARGAAELVAVVFSFDGDRIRYGTNYHDVSEAFRAVGMEQPT